jgi:O-antigen ligase
MLIPLILLCFSIITFYRFSWGMFLFFLFLPTYLLRFQIGFIPTTLLEGFFFIILLAWMYSQWKDKTYLATLQYLLQTHKSLLIAIGLFLLGATINLFFSHNILNAAGEWKAFFIEPVILFFILTDWLRKKDIQYVKNFVYTPLLLIGFVTAALAIFQHFTGWMVPWDFWENRNTYRVTGWYGFPNGVGLFLAPLFPLSLYIVVDTWGKMKKKTRSIQTTFQFFLALFLIPMTILGVYYAKSTGGLIGILGSMGVLLLICKKTRIPTIITGILCFVILFSLPATNPIRKELFFQDRSGQMRLDMWAEATELIIEHPIVGAGLSSYQKEIYPYRIDKWIEVFHHPHNIFLAMWVNIGIIGLVGFLWIIIWYTRVALMQSKNRHAAFLLAIMAVNVVMGLVDSPYIKNDLAFFFWIFPAILVILPYNKIALKK